MGLRQGWGGAVNQWGEGGEVDRSAVFDVMHDWPTESWIRRNM
jgi:hypothetical protein